MSYIAFDLDALNRAPAVARSAGVNEERIIAGLVRMWAWAFREETDQIDVDQLRGHFGIDASRALVAFGFLAPNGTTWRVRGAARYLRIKVAQRDAAKRTNERKRSAQSSDGRPTVDRRSTDAPPHGVLPLLHRAPSTEHRAPSTEEDPRVAEATPPAPLGELFESVSPDTPTPTLAKVKPPKAPKHAPDPRHAPTVKAVVEAFELHRGAAYPFAARDAGAVTALLTALGSPEAVESAWTRALTHKGWPSVATLPQLVQHLAHFVGSSEAKILGVGPSRIVADEHGGIF